MIAIEEIRAARERLAGKVLRTPLVPLDLPDQPGRIYLKLENLQPIGSFKLRGALNAVLQTDPDDLRGGVVTASAGNMGQGVAWAARELGLPCTVVVPDHAPETKLAAIERLGGNVLRVPYERWWQAIAESSFPEVEGAFIHPVQDERVMAGNGTVGLEILEDLPDVDRVLVPFGGGGLSVGIASAMKAVRPGTNVYAVEPETGAPLTAAFESGEPQPVEYQVSFVDGSGAPAVLPEMWPRAREALDGALSVSLDATADAVRLLVARARVVAEGAGALALAAALEHRWDENVVCVVSGGNIDASKLTQILAGTTP
ncbi:MAG: threonine/serine dehydratase [Gaiellaceae bacterium]